MGIGRLAFLEFVDEAIGNRADLAGHDRAIRGDYFVSRRLGLGFVKPSEWHFHAFEDFCPMLAGQELLNSSGDHVEDFEEHASNLVAVISKYPIGELPEGELTHFSPSITIFSNSEDREDVAADFEAAVLAGIENFQEMLRDYVVLEGPRFQTISMCPAAQYTAQFMFEHRACPPTLVRDKTLVVDQGHHVFSIHLYDSPATGECVGGEFDAFVGSLHLA